MLTELPTTLEEAILLIFEQDRLLQESKKTIAKITKDLKEKESCLVKAECEYTRLTEDNKNLKALSQHFQEMFSLLNEEKYGHATESYMKLLKSQPLLFSDEEMRIRMVDLNKLEAEILAEKEEKAKAKEIDQQEADEVTYENLDAEIDDTLNDDEDDNEALYSYETLKSYFDLAEDEKFCDKCGKPLHFAYIRSRTRWVLIPAKMIKQVIYYKVYECTDCVDEEAEDDGVSLKKSSNIKELIPQSKTSPSLLAFLMGTKYLQHSTFHTTSQVMTWQHMPISKQNINNWQQKIYKALLPLKEVFFEEQRKSQFLNMDETPLNVMKCKQEDIKKEYWPDYSPPDKEKEEKNIRECRIWVVSGKVDGHWIKTYNFRYTRSGTFVLPYLENNDILKVLQMDVFKGYTKALDVYNSMNLGKPPIDSVFCSVHSRRYFKDLFRLYKSKLAFEVLTIFKDIFHTDKELRNKFHKGLITEEEFLQLREDEVLPLYEKIQTKLKPYYKTGVVRPNSKLAEAINYFMDNYDGLVGYMKYSFLTPSNNISEISVKQAVLIRKNSLFSGSPIGAESSCFMLSLVQTCIVNKINPIDYLRCLFEQAPYAKTKEDWRRLTPWAITITPFKLEGIMGNEVATKKEQIA